MNPPSEFLLSEQARLTAAARLGPIADLACGRGRHALAVAAAGLSCIGVDINPRHLQELGAAARERGLKIDRVRADLEAASGFPLRPASCGAILVFRYLWRPLAPRLETSLARGGILLYETFTLDQRKLGYGPKNEGFLLQPNELAQLFPGLETLSYWEGMTEGEKPSAVARLVARRG